MLERGWAIHLSQRLFSWKLQLASCAVSFVLVSVIGGTRASRQLASAAAPASSVRSLPVILGSLPGPNNKHRAAILGADETFASDPYPLIQGWQDKQKGDAMVASFKAAGLRSLRLGFNDVYSPVSASESENLKAASKFTNQFPWFPFSD